MPEDYAGCGAEGCEHVAAPTRARCLTCQDWCYLDSPCIRGELDQVQTTCNDLEATGAGQHNELMRLREQLAAVRELHTATSASSSMFGAWCPTCCCTAPCRTLQAIDPEED